MQTADNSVREAIEPRLAAAVSGHPVGERGTAAVAEGMDADPGGGREGPPHGSALGARRGASHRTGLDVQRTTVGEVAATDLPDARRPSLLEEAGEAINSTGQRARADRRGSALRRRAEPSRPAGTRAGRGRAGSGSRHVLADISPNDLMYSGSWGAYVYAGVTAVQCIREVLGRLGRPAPASILDLPCGHGRELRFLKLAYPDARIGVCGRRRGRRRLLRARVRSRPDRLTRRSGCGVLRRALRARVVGIAVPPICPPIAGQVSSSVCS